MATVNADLSACCTAAAASAARRAMSSSVSRAAFSAAIASSVFLSSNSLRPAFPRCTAWIFSAASFKAGSSRSSSGSGSSCATLFINRAAFSACVPSSSCSWRSLSSSRFLASFARSSSYSVSSQSSSSSSALLPATAGAGAGGSAATGSDFTKVPSGAGAGAGEGAAASTAAFFSSNSLRPTFPRCTAWIFSAAALTSGSARSGISSASVCGSVTDGI